MRVLITGVTGFAGSHLAVHLSEKKGPELFGLCRPGSKERGPAGVKMIECDVLDTKRLLKTVRKVSPDRIFHLAAAASVARSWKDPDGTTEQNVEGTRSLLEAVRTGCPKARVHMAGSAEVYGSCRRPGEKLKENVPFRPLNPYAASKSSQELLGRQYADCYGLQVVCTRAFNHIGPGQSDAFVVSSFAKQVAAIEQRKQRPVIQVGNLDAIRDFTDVRDVVAAYTLCLEKGRPGEVFNVCSGKGRRIAEVLDFFLKRSAVRIAVEKSEGRLRSVDAAVLVGDPSLLRSKTGWTPQFTFERTLTDVLDHWRQWIKKGA